MGSLLEELQARGVTCELCARSIKVHAVKGALTPEIRELLRTRNAELVRELRALEQVSCSEGKPTTVEELADLIRGQLKDRPLPIVIGPGETIVDVEGYAKAEARAAFSRCELMADAAWGRLRSLGILS